MRICQARYSSLSALGLLQRGWAKSALASHYFQGVDGADADRQGSRGGGADPTRQGSLGGGALPTDAIGVRSECAATAIFRPIEATRMTMAAATANFRDIECLRGKKTRKYSIP